MLALEIEQMLTKPDYIVYNNNTKTFLNVCRNYHMWLDNMRCTDAYTALTFVYWSLQLADVWRRYVTDNMTCLQFTHDFRGEMFLAHIARQHRTENYWSPPTVLVLGNQFDLHMDVAMLCVSSLDKVNETCTIKIVC